MVALRQRYFSATLLLDGSVMVAGGFSGDDDGAWASAELYDPRRRSWTATANMGTPRLGHTATLLPSGMVLVAGGCCDKAASSTGTPFASAQLYDPAGGA